jgi:hypothetical protein
MSGLATKSSPDDMVNFGKYKGQGVKWRDLSKPYLDYLVQHIQHAGILEQAKQELKRREAGVESY